jgi:hypothetical protein
VNGICRWRETGRQRESERKLVGTWVQLKDLPFYGAHHVENGVQKQHSLFKSFDLRFDANFAVMHAKLNFGPSEFCF